MSEKQRPILVPQYMKKFRCIGPACEDSCCLGWRVNIDRETYRKYKRSGDEELKPLFEKYVKRNRASTHTDADYAKVVLLKDNRCPFLNEEKFCKIQLKNGEEYLSDVCATYPRIVNILNGVLERSATVSCPEVARLALIEHKGIEFDEDMEPSSIRNIIKNNINTHDLKFNLKPQKYLWELRIFTITVLQDRNYLLWERLVILGMFYQKLQDYIENKMIDEIPNLIASYTNLVEEGIFRENLASIPVQYNIQMELLKEIADERYFMGIPSKRYLECFSECLSGIQYTAESKVEDIGLRYQQAYTDYYEPFMKEHEYILENYLVNYVFGTLFPFTGEKNIFDSYMTMVLHYALIKMFLIGMAGFHKGLTIELVIKLIQSFSKTVEHSKAYVVRIAELMKKNNFNTMAYMTILIKN